VETPRLYIREWEFSGEQPDDVVDGDGCGDMKKGKKNGELRGSWP
jgi:hypothetical protein